MMHTNPEYRAPDGPRWLPGLQVWDQQIDVRGQKWRVVRVEQGGRVLHWETPNQPWRSARTEATPDHPEYPSDADVVAAARARKAAARL